MISVHEKIEKETLVQMFQEIVQAAKGPFNDAAQGHLVMPAFSVWLQRNGVNVVRNEAAVRARSKTKALSHHSTQDRMQPVLVVVGVDFHALDRSMNTHLTACNIDQGVDQVEIRQLAISAIIYYV